MADYCKHCDIELNEGMTEVSFDDEFTESNLTLTMSAVWCDSCGYIKLRRE